MKRTPFPLRRISFPVTVAVAAAACLALVGCAPAQRAYDAALLLADLRAGSGSSLLKQRTAEPVVTPLSYVIQGHAQQADLYQGDHVSRGTLVLIHGFTEEGRRDPRLVDLARSLARSGFRVLTPELPSFTDMTLGSRARADIALALRFAVQEGQATGLAAFSLAAGAALGAVAEPDLAERVSYLVLIGPYYDLADMIRYATTGRDAGSGRTVNLPQPVRQGRWLLLRSQLHHLDNDVDRVLLERIAHARMQDEHARIEREVEDLSPGGRALVELIDNTDPDRVNPLLERLPAALRAEMQTLDPARMDLRTLRPRVLLIHGAEDPVIAVSHSLRLKEAVGDSAQLFVPPGLDHVTLGAGLADAWVLWHAVCHLLEMAKQ